MLPLYASLVVLAHDAGFLLCLGSLQVARTAGLKLSDVLALLAVVVLVALIDYLLQHQVLEDACLRGVELRLCVVAALAHHCHSRRGFLLDLGCARHADVAVALRVGQGLHERLVVAALVGACQTGCLQRILHVVQDAVGRRAVSLVGGADGFLLGRADGDYLLEFKDLAVGAAVRALLRECRGE